MSDLERAERVMRLAWLSLPEDHRQLLVSIGAAQWRVVDEPLGVVVDGFLRSAGHRGLRRADRAGLEGAVAVVGAGWILGHLRRLKTRPLGVAAGCPAGS
jgi:hypothetical protein